MKKIHYSHSYGEHMSTVQAVNSDGSKMAGELMFYDLNGRDLYQGFWTWKEGGIQSMKCLGNQFYLYDMNEDGTNLVERHVRISGDGLTIIGQAVEEGQENRSFVYRVRFEDCFTKGNRITWKSRGIAIMGEFHDIKINLIIVCLTFCLTL